MLQRMSSLKDKISAKAVEAKKPEEVPVKKEVKLGEKSKVKVEAKTRKKSREK